MKTQVVVDAGDGVRAEVGFAPPVVTPSDGSAVASCLGRRMLLQLPPAGSCITRFPPRPEQLRNVSCFEIGLNLRFFFRVEVCSCTGLGGRKQLLK